MKTIPTREEIKKELKGTVFLKELMGVEFYMEKQMEKESSKKIDAERFEPELFKRMQKKDSKYTTEDCTSYGLFQILLMTAKDYDFIGGKEMLIIPMINLGMAIKILDELYGKFSEIPDKKERLKFAFASYNAGRGNINKILSDGRREELGSSSYKAWKENGAKEGLWQNWNNVKKFLKNHTGSNSDITLRYIDYILNI